MFEKFFFMKILKLERTVFRNSELTKNLKFYTEIPFMNVTKNIDLTSPKMLTEEVLYSSKKSETFLYNIHIIYEIIIL